MKFLLSFIFAWGLTGSAAHLGKGARETSLCDDHPPNCNINLEIYDDDQLFKYWHHNGCEDKKSNQHTGYQGPILYKCDDPIFADPKNVPPDAKMAEWKDCKAILDRMGESCTGHGRWYIIELATSPSSTVKKFQSCNVDLSRQDGSDPRPFHFGDEDLRNIILGKRGTTYSASRWSRGSMKCVNATIDFKMYRT
ncbi:hypothetical protein PG996_013218 [Apiospora saccharicola]|uniref:Ecp2 effector protein-like domain-containing protein n=1 Tax=Apiospora saccharicola TaxID=335842 RepID=A0ABR1U5D7_9PEZI